VLRRILAVLSLALLFLAGALAADYWLLSRQSTAANAVGGPFTLTDENNVVRHAGDFRGKLMLVYFGYTYCPDACPTALQQIGQTLERLGKDADAVQPLFITVDPARDTVAQMKLYMQNFSPRILALTGTPEEVAAVAREYHIYYQKVEQPGGEYLMDHSSLIDLMGRDGKCVAQFPPGMTPAAMADAIKKYL
jgi:protein SCO1/2